MASPRIDFVGKVGDPSTQGLGRLIGQYVNSPKLIGLLTGLYSMANDLQLLAWRMSRAMNPDDDINLPGNDGAYPINTAGAGQDAPTSTTNQQLDAIGNMVQMLRRLPSGALMDNALFYDVIAAKIHRNRAAGGTVQEIVDQLVRIFHATSGTTIPMTVDEVGRMCCLVVVGREVTADEASLFAVSGGVNFIAGNIIARPAGVRLLLAWQDAGCFSFSTSANPGVPLVSGGVGFNTDTSSTDGRWASTFGGG